MEMNIEEGSSDDANNKATEKGGEGYSEYIPANVQAHIFEPRIDEVESDYNSSP